MYIKKEKETMVRQLFNLPMSNRLSVIESMLCAEDDVQTDNFNQDKVYQEYNTSDLSHQDYHL